MRQKKLGIVVLAGGARLRKMVPDGRGGLVPRAFGPGSSLEGFSGTVARARALVPDARIRVSVVEAERSLWGPETSGLPGSCLVVQPLDRGSAAGVFLPFLQLFRNDPSVVLAVLPSDLGVEGDSLLAQAVLVACERAASRSDRLYLLGAPPETEDVDAPWLLPIPYGTEEVPLIVEASHGNVRSMGERGALFWTGIAVGSAAALLMAFDRGMPGLLPLLARHAAGRELESVDWGQAYREMAYGSFRRHVLRPASELLGLVRVDAGCVRPRIRLGASPADAPRPLPAGGMRSAIAVTTR